MGVNKYNKLKVFYFGKEIKTDIKLPAKQCLIFGNFGAMNTGDEAILAGELFEIRKNFPDIKISVVSRYPASINKTHGKNILAITVKNSWGILQQVLISNFIIVGGGGLFNKSRDGVRGLIYQAYFIFMFIFIPLVFAKPVYVLGVGVYSNVNKWILTAAVALFKKVKLVTVRDFHSKKLLGKHNVKVKLYKDNSYLLEIPWTNKRPLKFLKSNFSTRKINIGLSLRTPFIKSDIEILKNAIVDVMKQNKNYVYWLYNLDNNTGKMNDSIINNIVFREASKFKVNVNKLKFSNNSRAVFESFAYMDKFICMRLHSMIFSDRLSKPFVGIPYDIKCTDFLNSTGNKSLVIDNKLTEKLIDFIKHDS